VTGRLTDTMTESRATALKEKITTRAQESGRRIGA
jgi:hypothetical protein